MSVAGPKKVIDLDLLPESEWKIEPEALHLYNNKLWRHEKAGCVLCVECERNDAHGQTLSATDSPHQFICLTHGLLEEIPYCITRNVIVKIGSYERTGTQNFNDFILMPIDMDQDEREELLDRLISAAAESESAPDDSDVNS